MTKEDVLFKWCTYESEDENFIYLKINDFEIEFWNKKENNLDSDNPRKMCLKYLTGHHITENYFKFLD